MHDMSLLIFFRHTPHSEDHFLSHVNTSMINSLISSLLMITITETGAGAVVTDHILFSQCLMFLLLHWFLTEWQPSCLTTHSPITLHTLLSPLSPPDTITGHWAGGGDVSWSSWLLMVGWEWWWWCGEVSGVAPAVPGWDCCCWGLVTTGHSTAVTTTLAQADEVAEDTGDETGGVISMFYDAEQSSDDDPVSQVQW